MVGIREIDRDMLRFLWFKDFNDSNFEIAYFRFIWFVFGLRLSLVVLVSIIRYYLDVLVFEEFKLEFIEVLKNFLYVDDFVIGEENEAKIMDLYMKFNLVM